MTLMDDDPQSTHVLGKPNSFEKCAMSHMIFIKSISLSGNQTCATNCSEKYAQETQEGVQSVWW